MDDPSLGQSLNRAARLLRRLADRRLASLGVSSGYLPVLGALAAGEALPQKALTEVAGIEQPTMAATLGRMERDGLVARQADPDDRRSARFSLTEATAARRAAIEAAVEALNEEAVEDLTPEELQLLRRALQRVIARVERSLEAAP